MAQPPICEQDIVDGLRRLGVQPGAVVEVHSSLPGKKSGMRPIIKG